MTAPGASPDDEILAGAYLDGELDAVSARQFEERLASERELAALHARLKALRDGLRAARADDDVPEGFRLRLAGPPARARMMPRAWRAIAASLLVGAFVGGAATFALVPQSGRDAAAPFIAAHVRALMAPQPVDVASSDHHTVKPWFDGKLTFAPKVIDLAPQGFPLVGGRVDVVDLQPAASLVYRAGKHLISLTELPGRGAAPLSEKTERGYMVFQWADADVTYWAVTDAAEPELRAFVSALQAAER